MRACRQASLFVAALALLAVCWAGEAKAQYGSVGTAAGYLPVGTTTVPASMLGVYGGVTIGTSYISTTAPSNGAIIQGNVGIGTTVPTYDLSFGGAANREIWTERSTSGAGSNLTVQAGGALSGGTNLNGGNLVLQSGTATGSGISNIVFNIPNAGGAGTSDEPTVSALKLGTTLNDELTLDTPYAYHFHINGTAGLDINGPNPMYMTFGDTTTHYRIIFNTIGPYTGIGTLSGGALLLGPTSGSSIAPGVAILTNSDVGIGTTAPVNMLDVNGASVIGASYAGVNTAPSNGLLVQGNVGIGTTAPQSKLHVQAGEVQVGSSGASCASANAGAIRYNSGTLYYCDNASTWESIDSSGTSPTGDYYIATQTATPTTGQGLFGGASTLGGILAGYGSTADLTLENRNDTPALQILANSTNVYMPGNVGIGTTAPTRELDVAGSVTHSTGGLTSQIALRSPTAPTNKLNLGYDTTSHYGFIEAVNESTAWQNLALQPSGGNVGIGTTAPNASALLDVFSTTQGLLPPRVTATQEAAIGTNSAMGGLVVYNTTANELDVYNSSTAAWEAVGANAADAAGSTGQIQFNLNSSNELGANANFVWDNTHDRLGINKPSPRQAEEITGSLELTESGNIGWTTTLSPEPYGRLVLSGGLILGANGDGNAIYYSGTGASYFSFGTGTGHSIAVFTAGNIGSQNAFTLSNATWVTPSAGGNTYTLLNFPGTLSSTGTVATLRGLYTGLTDSGTAADTLIGVYSDVSLGTNTSAIRYAGVFMGGNVGIGTTVPDSPLTVNSSTSGLQAPGSSNTGTELHISGADTAKSRVLIDAYGTGVFPDLTLRLARGTAGSPSAVQSGDQIGILGGNGYGASAYSGAAAQISFDATDNWTNSDNGAAIAFLTTTNGGTTLAERMRIDNTGYVGIGTTSPATSLVIQAGGVNNVTNIGQLSGNGNYSGIAFTASASSAVTTSNYSLLGDGTDTLIGRPTGGGMYFTENNTPEMTIATGGNVGIGTTAPGTSLQVGTDLSMAYNWPAIGFNINAGTGTFMTTNYGSEIIENYTAGYLEISSYTSGTAGSGLGSGSQLVLSSNGNIGIGTTAPQSLLHVYGGEVQVGSSGASCATAVNGALRFSGTTLYVCSGTTWKSVTTSSDRRLKRDIVALPENDGLASIMKMRPVRFHWKDTQQDKDEGEQIGLIAQDVEEVYPASGIIYKGGTVTLNLGDGKKETIDQVRGMNYDRLVVPLIKAVQEEQAQIESLKAANDNLEARLKALEAARH